MSFADFRRAHPKGEVLSRDTGKVRNYGRNPYQGYDTRDQPFFVEAPDDGRLPAMERVLRVEVDTADKLYPFRLFRGPAAIEDTVGGTPIVVLGRPGTLSALDDSAIRDSREVPSAAAFDRRLDGEVLTFVIRSGRVVDEETGSAWDLLGRAVSGALAGKRLKPVQSDQYFAFAWLSFKPSTPVYGAD